MASCIDKLRKGKTIFRVVIFIEIIIAIMLVYYSASLIRAVELSLNSLPSAEKRPIPFAGIFTVMFCTITYLIIMGLSCGECMKSKYTTKLAVFFAHLLMAGILAFGVSTFLGIKSEIGQYNQKTASAAFAQYNVDEKMRTKIDNFQIQNKCCGVNNYTDWKLQNDSCILEETPSCALPPSCFKTKVNTTDNSTTSDSYWPSFLHPVFRLNEVNSSQCQNESEQNCTAHPFALPFLHDKNDSQDSQAAENIEYPLHLHEFFDEDYFKQEKEEEFFKDGCLPKIDRIYEVNANGMLYACILSLVSLVTLAYTIWVYYLVHLRRDPVGVELPGVALRDVVLPDVVPVNVVPVDEVPVDETAV